MAHMGEPCRYSAKQNTTGTRENVFRLHLYQALGIDRFLVEKGKMEVTGNCGEKELAFNRHRILFGMMEVLELYMDEAATPL